MRAPFTTNYSRTLMVDASTAQGGQLSDQLNHAGFSAEFAVSWHMARATLRANHYHSYIVVADLDQVEDLKQLNELRRVAMSVWIIVLCELLARRQGVTQCYLRPFLCSISLRGWQPFRFAQDRHSFSREQCVSLSGLTDGNCLSDTKDQVPVGQSTLLAGCHHGCKMSVRSPRR